MVMLVDGKTIELKAFNRAWNEYRIENDLEIHLEKDKLNHLINPYRRVIRYRYKGFEIELKPIVDNSILQKITIYRTSMSFTFSNATNFRGYIKPRSFWQFLFNKKTINGVSRYLFAQSNNQSLMEVFLKEGGLLKKINTLRTLSVEIKDKGSIPMFSKSDEDYVTVTFDKLFQEPRDFTKGIDLIKCLIDAMYSCKLIVTKEED